MSPRKTDRWVLVQQTDVLPKQTDESPGLGLGLGFGYLLVRENLIRKHQSVDTMRLGYIDARTHWHYDRSVRGHTSTRTNRCGDTLALGHIGARTHWHMGKSVRGHIGTRTNRCGHTLALGHIGAWTHWHYEISVRGDISVRGHTAVAAHCVGTHRCVPVLARALKTRG